MGNSKLVFILTQGGKIIPYCLRVPWFSLGKGTVKSKNPEQL
jgi:hypothetical protein